MLIIPYPRLYNSLYTFGEFVIHVWISRYPRLENPFSTFGEFIIHVWIICSPRLESLLFTTGNLSLHGGEIFPFIAGICISYRKDDDKPCFIDLII